jgi:hypothetical protein
LSPAKRRRTVERVVEDLHVPERRVCRALGQSRSTQRYSLRLADDEPRLVQDIVRLARQYGRYGYRRVDLPPFYVPPGMLLSSCCIGYLGM